MFKDRLKKLRLSKGLTLQQVGDQFDISAASVANWENGKSQPDSRKLSRLADIFGCSVGFLLEGDRTIPSTRDENCFSSVPFVPWPHVGTLNLSSLPPVLVAPLHIGLSGLGFATRYPGSTELHWSQGPIPAGSLIFVDPQKEPSTNCLVLISDKKSELSLARVQMGVKSDTQLLLPVNSFNDLVTTKEVTIIGCVVEWRLSGVV